MLRGEKVRKGELPTIASVFEHVRRIRQEKNGGAWCPKAQISSAIREYLEIDLTRNHLIAWTETQGRYGNGQGQEYAETFFLEYWREAAWHQYKTLTGERVRVLHKSPGDGPEIVRLASNRSSKNIGVTGFRCYGATATPTWWKSRSWTCRLSRAECDSCLTASTHERSACA